MSMMTPKKKSSNWWGQRFILYGLLIGSSLIMLAPFYWSVSTSFKSEQFIFANPPQWIPSPFVLDNYLSVFTRVPFARYLLNSILVAAGATFAHVFFDTLAAYAFAKLRFPGRDKVFFLLLLGLMIPFQVNLIPLYSLMSSLHWLDTYAALLVPNLTGIFGIFMLRQFIQSIPDEILDSARIDGCSEFGIFRRIVFPLARAGLATLIIFTFMGVWNDFLWPRLTISSETMFTLPIGLAQLQSKNTSSWGQIMAGTVLTALPMIVVYLLMQRQFIEGMTAGAVKE